MTIALEAHVQCPETTRHATQLVWTREMPLSVGRTGESYKEAWIARHDAGQEVARWTLDTRTGKRFDAVGFKGGGIDGLKHAAQLIRGRINDCPKVQSPETVERCPMCDDVQHDCKPLLTWRRVGYLLCRACGHAFVSPRPSQRMLELRYESSEALAEPYVDRTTIERRLTEIVKPKLDWVLESLRQHGLGHPRTLLDVGAGGGHFVHSAIQKGLEAEGVELSAVSRCFARNAFGIEMLPRLEQCSGEFDVVSFWGSLQYWVDPRRTLEAAAQLLSEFGCVVLELPRVESFSTAVQCSFQDQITRHLDPTSHLHMFSDASAATMLWRAGLQPIAVWYFGMDMYEWLINAMMHEGGEAPSERMRGALNTLQQQLDGGKLSDGMAIVAISADRMSRRD